MKVTKIVKYNYKLTEETLEKDIERFISDARKGDYSWDYKCGGEGIKIIKQYFKILKEKLSKEEYQECKECYKKLILFLFDASVGEDEACFGYEDLLSKTSKDFDQLIRNYFTCLVKICDIGELSNEIAEYAIKLWGSGSGFDSDTKVLIQNLEKLFLENLINRMLIKTEGMTKKDEDKQGIVYFLMKIAEEQEDKEKYLKLCERFRGVLPDNEFEYLKKEWDEDDL
jgi:hypothetical protein